VRAASKQAVTAIRSNLDLGASVGNADFAAALPFVVESNRIVP